MQDRLFLFVWYFLIFCFNDMLCPNWHGFHKFVQILMIHFRSNARDVVWTHALKWRGWAWGTYNHLYKTLTWSQICIHSNRDLEIVQNFDYWRYWSFNFSKFLIEKKPQCFNVVSSPTETKAVHLISSGFVLFTVAQVFVPHWYITHILLGFECPFSTFCSYRRDFEHKTKTPMVLPVSCACWTIWACTTRSLACPCHTAAPGNNLQNSSCFHAWHCLAMHD